MTQTTLHYIYDPLCGWCYAVAPLVRAAREILPVVGHGGGLLTGARRQQVSLGWRDYVLPKDAQIAALTGQVFGRAYQESLLRDHTAWLDSEPPTTGTLAAEQSAGRGLDFLDAVQTAHYHDGRRVADVPVLEEIARELGLDLPAFRAAYESCRGEATRAHFSQSQALLAKVGGEGFPTFALERDGHLTVLDYDAYFRDPADWQRALQAHAGSARPNVAATPRIGK